MLSLGGCHYSVMPGCCGIEENRLDKNHIFDDASGIYSITAEALPNVGARFLVVSPDCHSANIRILHPLGRDPCDWMGGKRICSTVKRQFPISRSKPDESFPRDPRSRSRVRA
jgi:hypothetical protein